MGYGSFLIIHAMVTAGLGGEVMGIEGDRFLWEVDVEQRAAGEEGCGSADTVGGRDNDKEVNHLCGG